MRKETGLLLRQKWAKNALEKGEMFFSKVGKRPIRLQPPIVSEEEIEVFTSWTENTEPPNIEFLNPKIIEKGEVMKKPPENKRIRSVTMTPQDALSEKTIIIKGLEIKLGDKKSEVIQKLGPLCHLTELSNEDGYQVTPKENDAGSFWIIHFARHRVSSFSICRPQAISPKVNWLGIWNKTGHGSGQQPEKKKSSGDPARIIKTLEVLWELWRQKPEWRFGQLLLNCSPSLQAQKDFFYLKDEVLLEGLMASLSHMKPAERPGENQPCPDPLEKN